MKTLKWLALVSFLLVSCNTPGPETQGVRDFFLGEWSRSEPFGDNQTTMTSWTFRKDGTLTRDGYPAFFAEARYKVRSVDKASATLALHEKTGPQSDTLPAEMVVRLDPETGTLSVDGGPPLTRQKSATGD